MGRGNAIEARYAGDPELAREASVAAEEAERRGRPLQAEIIAALKGRSLSLDELARAVGVNVGAVEVAVVPYVRSGMVEPAVGPLTTKFKLSELGREVLQDD